MLLLAILDTREGIPFPAFIEALLMEFFFEIMREAGIRLPKPVGSAVSIVGALVIGQAAIEAKIASPIMVIIVALSDRRFTFPLRNMYE
ncbi:spore germination protein [Paenibacillus sp. LjRoot56]|uniref:spore germination protein n=1 Tax=Paenibacillus sp. LjRoot56 TaxID=3342333 RepID=UPI003F4FC3D8